MEKFKQLIKKAFSYPAMLRKTHPVTGYQLPYDQNYSNNDTHRRILPY